MKNLQELISRCKASVTLTINNHRDYYQTIEDYLQEMGMGGIKETDLEIIAEIIKLDTLVELQFYPETPVGFYMIYHYDIDKAIEQGLEVLNGNLHKASV